MVCAKAKKLISLWGEGKQVLIKYVEESDPDPNGVRILSFLVNGSVRTVRIQDKNLEVKSDNKLKADKSNPGHLGSSIPGTVGKILVKEGDTVTVNMPLMTVEAMKMETTVVSKGQRKSRQDPRIRGRQRKSGRPAYLLCS